MSLLELLITNSFMTAISVFLIYTISIPKLIRFMYKQIISRLHHEARRGLACTRRGNCLIREIQVCAIHLSRCSHHSGPRLDLGQHSLSRCRRRYASLPLPFLEAAQRSHPLSGADVSERLYQVPPHLKSDDKTRRDFGGSCSSSVDEVMLWLPPLPDSTGFHRLSSYCSFLRERPH